MKSDWSKLLGESLQQLDPVPKGFKTMRQLAEEMKLNPRTINTRILALGDRVQTKSFRIKSGHVIRPVPHYRIR